jgi:hypothetical protein
MHILKFKFCSDHPYWTFKLSDGLWYDDKDLPKDLLAKWQGHKAANFTLVEKLNASWCRRLRYCARHTMRLVSQ